MENWPHDIRLLFVQVGNQTSVRIAQRHCEPVRRQTIGHLPTGFERDVSLMGNTSREN